MINRVRIYFLVTSIVSCSAIAYAQGVDAFAMNWRLGRAVNLGNALEAPSEGQWGVTLREEYFQIIKDGGFDAVRIPIRWNAHADTEAPYTIEPAFFDRIDWAVNNALSRGLVAIIDFHHYNELMDDPGRFHQERFLALWRQIAEHYRSFPDDLLFELLNEPHGDLTHQIWNDLLSEALDIIRETNPTRNVIIGATGYNGKQELVNRLQLPSQDRHIIATFHHYSPFHFTHQGAAWASGSDAWLGTTWEATAKQVRQITEDFDDILHWSRANDRPVFMGEFGAYSEADMDSRVLWTSTSARQAEARGFSWAYWEFCAGFGAYDDGIGKWNRLHRALVPDAPVQNQVRNCEFDFATDHWSKQTGSGGGATLSTVSTAELSGANALKVAIDAAGSSDECVVVSQSDMILESGKLYKVSFVAKAEAGRTIRATLQQGARFTYWQQTARLTTEPKTFAYLFQCGATDSEVDIRFLLGGNSADVYIDKVVIKQAWDCRTMINTGLRLPADVSGPGNAADCYADFHDLSLMAEQWLSNSVTCDITGRNEVPDGVVDFCDFSVVAGQWLTCNNLQDLECDI